VAYFGEFGPDVKLGFESRMVWAKKWQYHPDIAAEAGYLVRNEKLLRDLVKRGRAPEVEVEVELPLAVEEPPVRLVRVPDPAPKIPLLLAMLPVAVLSLIVGMMLPRVMAVANPPADSVSLEVSDAPTSARGGAATRRSR
jgi:hypothetical protein